MTLRRLDDFPPQHPAWDLLTGRTPFQASSIDQRFSFTTYIPTAYRHSTAPLPLLVAVHGTGRRPEEVRDRFIRFAEEHAVVVLAPLFPIGIEEPDDVDNYKNLRYADTRFDEVLLGMIADAGERWRLDTERFLLAGFSGGGQFAHRFAYLHPDRLRAVSIGAPGRVTLPDAEPWPHGIGDLYEVFGRDADLDALGAEDDARDTLAIVASDAREARAGVTRVERAHTLARALISRGVPVETVVVVGVAHDADATSAPVIDFLSRALTQPSAI